MHELDYTDGLIPFFSMRLASGQTLEDAIKDPQVFTAAAPHMSALDIIFKKIQVMSKVCEAMVYAHSKGIVHRDLKPENIMIGDFGEVQVMDWGLAKILVEEEKDCVASEELVAVDDSDDAYESNAADDFLHGRQSDNDNDSTNGNENR